MTTFGKAAGAMLLVVMLFACGSHIEPSPKLGERALNDFSSALRWNRFKTAASLMLPEYRQNFTDTFSEVRDIHIVDVRSVDVVPSDDNSRFEAVVEMDYYLLPSVTVKTFTFEQTWEFFDGQDQSQPGYFITTPFPLFP